MNLVYIFIITVLFGCGSNTNKEMPTEVLQSIQFSSLPDVLTLAQSKSLILEANYILNGTEKQNIISKNITYKSSDDSIATITANGQLHLLKEGTVTITAFYKNKTTMKTIDIVSKTLKTVEIIPATQAELSILAEHKSFINQVPIRLKVVGYYEDNITEDVTDIVTWKSHSSFLKVLKSGYLVAQDDGNVSLSVELDGVENTILLPVRDYEIVDTKIMNFNGIEIFPTSLSINKGTYIVFSGTPSSYTITNNDYQARLTLGLIGFYADDSNKTLNPAWSLDNNGISLNQTSYLSKNVGLHTLTATLPNLVKEINTTVTDAIIKHLHFYMPLSRTITNQTFPLKLSEIYAHNSDGTRLNLTESDLSFHNLTPDLISLQNSMITTYQEGMARIECIYENNGKRNVKEIPLFIGHVDSIRGKYKLFSLAVGATKRMGLLGHIELTYPDSLIIKPSRQDSDITAYVIWESLTPNIATITEDGNITGVSKGVAQIRVTTRTSENNLSKIVTQSVY